MIPDCNLASSPNLEHSLFLSNSQNSISTGPSEGPWYLCLISFFVHLPLHYKLEFLTE